MSRTAPADARRVRVDGERETGTGGSGRRLLRTGGPGLWSLATLGLTVGVSLAIFVGGGLWLDSATKRSPLFVLIGLAVGIVAAVLIAYREIRTYL